MGKWGSSEKMNISIINGSPKPGESTSGLLIKYLLQETGESNAQVFKCSLQATELAEIASSDVLVFVFPLYVDSIPSHLEKTFLFHQIGLVFYGKYNQQGSFGCREPNQIVLKSKIYTKE